MYVCMYALFVCNLPPLPGIQPSLDVTVCVSEPLLSGVQLSDSNLLKVTVETAYSVPEVWNPVSGSGPLSSYVAALQVPLTAEVSDKRPMLPSELEPIPFKFSQYRK